jgi:hypothetical protein
MHYIAGKAPILRRRLIYGRAYKPAAINSIRGLEAFGCDVNARDKFNNTPLHKCVASPLERGDLIY